MAAARTLGLVALLMSACSVAAASPADASAVADTAPTVVCGPAGDPRAATLTLLAGATSTVEAVVYKLEDPLIARALRGALARGVTVRLLVDGKEADEQESLVARMRAAGAAVVPWPRTRGKLHAKLLLVDRSVAVVGSYNWTRSGGEKNTELIVVLRDPKAVARLLENFVTLWQAVTGEAPQAASARYERDGVDTMESQYEATVPASRGE
jgi:phosphatidylserine/phosphatidylglycerophosphate/cardiolipin synthase-like enzyme